jgi:catechol 2,3-dioxygenase-like lactoylglutathione lyase family enzyme
MILGIGGTYIYAEDAARLAAWYRDVLGIETADHPAEGYYTHDFPVREHDGAQRATRTLWAIFQLEPGQRRAPQSFSVNYRVSDLTAMLERLRSLGVEIENIEEHEFGRFAWIRDPEENLVELFEDLRMRHAGE